jgi:hypothetical protein
MGRAYAGVMGPLAFLTTLVRCQLRSVSVETTVVQAVLCLFVFAAIGGVIGQLAGWIVDDSVRARLAAEIAASVKASNKGAPAGPVKIS